MKKLHLISAIACFGFLINMQAAPSLAADKLNVADKCPSVNTQCNVGNGLLYCDRAFHIRSVIYSKVCLCIQQRRNIRKKGLWQCRTLNKRGEHKPWKFPKGPNAPAPSDKLAPDKKK